MEEINVGNAGDECFQAQINYGSLLSHGIAQLSIGARVVGSKNVVRRFTLWLQPSSVSQFPPPSTPASGHASNQTATWTSLLYTFTALCKHCDSTVLTAKLSLSVYSHTYDDDPATPSYERTRQDFVAVPFAACT